jgi:nucleotide-binding universal stress UspA family protein
MSNRPIVIVPVDGSPETERTDDFASSVARRAAADLHMVHVLSRAGGRWIGPEAETGVRARLRALRPLMEREGLRVRTITLRGRPESVIPAYAQLNAASTIVVSRNYGTSSFWRSGAIASRIGRSSPVPVIVLPTSAPVEPVAPSLKHIMVAVDFNVASAIGVRTAADLARRHGARLTMVHAITCLPHDLQRWGSGPTPERAAGGSERDRGTSEEKGQSVLRGRCRVPGRNRRSLSQNRRNRRQQQRGSHPDGRGAPNVL